MVHGLLGFDRVKVGPFTALRYFPGIEDALVAAGHRVGVPSLSKTRSVACRAGELRVFINERFPNERVHVIGHSMGGLDARYMISRLGMHERVQSLITIATPHRGSSFADWALRRFRRLGLPLLHYWGIPTDAFDDLTIERCARFNEEVPDAPGVRYLSVAGQCPTRLVTPVWRFASLIVSKLEGPNDGVVSLNSARYGEHFEVWDGDHMSLVNRRNPRANGWSHRPSDYVRLIQRVQA